MKNFTKFKIGDKVVFKKPVLGRSNDEFTVVTMNSDGKKLTIYSKKWEDDEYGHRGNERDFGSLMGTDYGHWNVNECEIEFKIESQPTAEQVSNRYPDKARPDEEIGTKHIAIDGSTFKRGDVLTLTLNDKTKNPKFSNGSEEHYMSWVRLAPYQKEVKPVDLNASFQDKPYNDEIIGTKYRVICDEKPYYQIGDIVEYRKNDRSSAPLFYNPRRKDTVYVKWVHLQRINNTETTTIFNLNTQQDGSKISTDFNPESFLCSVSAAYSTGSSPVGVAVCYSREEILMGG